MPSVITHKKMLWTFVALTAGLLGGCQTQSATPAAPSPEAINKVQDFYVQQMPNAPIGRVASVLTDPKLAAVNQVVHQDQLKEGDRVTFIDVNQQIVAHGHVSSVSGEYVNVDYENDVSGGRVPREGDLMIKVTE